MIGRAELSRLAARAKVGERVQEKDYVLAWLLRAVSDVGDQRLVFKGGTALRRCYFDDYRYSEDLDFTVTEPALQGALGPIVDRWCAIIEGDAGIVASAAPDAEEPDVRFWVSFTGPLAARREKEIKLDFAFDERVHTDVVFPTIRSSYSDVQPDVYSLPTYSLVEIWAEKTRSLLQRTQPRDVYDMLSLSRLDPDLAHRAYGTFVKKAADKGLDHTQIAQVLDAREAKIRRMWEQNLAHQVVDLEPFDTAWREVRRALRDGQYL